MLYEVVNNKKEKSDETMVGFSFATEQDMYYDGLMGSDIEYMEDNWEYMSEVKSYREFMNDTSDDAYIWLKRFGNVLVG